MQWLDRPTAAVLAFAARRLADEPVGLLLAQRTTGDAPAPLGLDRRRASASTASTWPRSASAPSSACCSAGSAGFPSRPVLHHVHELSGGNPFFALELGRAVQAGIAAPASPASGCR